MDKMKKTIKRLVVRAFCWSAGGPKNATCRLQDQMPLTAENLLLNYAQGMFPMGDSDGSVHWKSPEERGALKPGEIHVSRRLKPKLRNGGLEVTFDQQFETVVENCADRDQAWINGPLKAIYRTLHDWGAAHSVEAWRDRVLVGGGFGIGIGKVFFLESMYCHEDHASKVAFVKLAKHLGEGGFEFIDCQYLSEHWKRFGFKAIRREELVETIAKTLPAPAHFCLESEPSLLLPIHAIADGVVSV